MKGVAQGERAAAAPHYRSARIGSSGWRTYNSIHSAFLSPAAVPAFSPHRSTLLRLHEPHFGVPPVLPVMSPTAWFRRRPAPAAEKPLRDELLSIERLEERALALAASFTVDPNPRRRARDTFPRFEDNARVLRDAYRTLADDVRTGRVRRVRRPNGCSTTSTWSPPRSATSARTCRARTTASCRRSPRASRPATRASTRWPSS